MRNFIAFIKRFQVFLFFAILQIIALSIYFTYSLYPRSQYLTAANSVSGTILEWEYALTKHFSLSGNNTRLQKENIALRKQLKSSYMQIDRQHVRIDDTLYKKQYEYIPAEIINSATNKRNNYFTINVGTAQGVRRHDGVFSSNGVVGVVHAVGTHYSIVKTCLTQDINIGLIIDKSGESGFLKWDGKDPKYGSMMGVSNDLKIKIGSTVMTKGSAGIFPSGIKVGTVVKTTPVEGQPIWDIKVKFAEDFRTIQRVYVVQNLLKEEQIQLENQIPE